MTEEEQAKELLKKYAEGKLDAEGIKKVERWYASLEDNSAKLGADKKAQIKNVMLLKLQATMQVKKSHHVRKMNTFIKMTGIAAALLITGSLGYKFLLSSPSSQPIVKTQVYAIQTTAEEAKTITLADGSKIELNPSSRITYSKTFGQKDRTIELTEGEAFFNIAHDVQRPFLVKTADHITTKVLGTSFRIKSYKARKNLDVLVATGKVTVGNDQQVFATLIRGQQLSFDKKAQRAEVAYTRSPAAIPLNFNNTTLQQALKELEYIYSITISLEDQNIANLKCTAAFTSKQEPEEILDILCSLHHLKFNHTPDHKSFKIHRL